MSGPLACRCGEARAHDIEALQREETEEEEDDVEDEVVRSSLPPRGLRSRRSVCFSSRSTLYHSNRGTRDRLLSTTAWERWQD